MIDLLRAIGDEAAARHLAYQREGVIETYGSSCPPTLRSGQLGYTHYILPDGAQLHRRLPDLISRYRESVRRCAFLGSRKRGSDRWTPEHARAVFARLTPWSIFTAVEGLHQVHGPNLSGIGGLHIGPTAVGILADLVVPALLVQDPSIRLQLPDDIRELLLQDLLEHMDAIGRPGGQIVLVDPKYAADGPDEPDAIAEYYRQRHGLSVLHADAGELRLCGDEVYYGDVRVDVVYRDASVLDLMEAAEEGVDVAPMRALLRQNRVVSSIAAELDQKSCSRSHRPRAGGAVPDGGGAAGGAAARAMDAHRLPAPHRVTNWRTSGPARVLAHRARVART
jgi:hypothetical protein